MSQVLSSPQSDVMTLCDSKHCLKTVQMLQDVAYAHSMLTLCADKDSWAILKSQTRRI